MKNKLAQRARRSAKSRSKTKGSAERPRLTVFRSNVHIYAQLIDDASGKTLASLSDKSLGAKEQLDKVERAYQVGLKLAKKAKAKKISEVSFDRSGYKYHGRVEALAKGARKGGLKF